MKFYLTLIVLLDFFLDLLQCQKQCDPSDCNHEGQCSMVGNAKSCKCIGSQYFQGPQCLEKIDHCSANPCLNGGECHSLVGQFVCSNCNKGYGGMKCDVQLPNLFQNMVVIFNHYGVYAKPHKFLMLLADVGTVPFSVEFVAENYVIDSFENSAEHKETLWKYSFDLFKILQKHNIRHHNDLPFRSGFYHLMNETFWDVDVLTLTLSVYDMATASELLYYQTFDLLIENRSSMKCIHKMKFPHGSDPMEPLKVDIARFNNFDFALLDRCRENSSIKYNWSIFDSIGQRKLYDFGITQIPLLKIPPYRIWFNYHGSVMSSYSLVVQISEKWEDKHIAITEGRCFIFVLPKPLQAIIKGGLTREHGVGQSLLLDGSESRDFGLAPNAEQTLSYHWTCYSEEDPGNSACKNLQSTRKQLSILPQRLKSNATYQFSLTIQSKVNLLSEAVVKQTILVEEPPKLFVNIQCIRNCVRNQFNSARTIHLKIECISWAECPLNSTYLWSIDGTIDGTEQHLFYMPGIAVSSIAVTALVWHNKLEGKSSLNLTKNAPPIDGKCLVDPQDGQAFHTEFHILCENFQDIDVPLIYHYTTDDFLLERTNDPDVHFRLPVSATIQVEVCDAYESCTEIILPVTVRPLDKPENLTVFLNHNESNVNELLVKGNRLVAMVLLKSLTPSINTVEDLLELLHSIENFHILTLEELEQSLGIGLDIIQNLLPLDNEKSIAMHDFFKKLHDGLKSIQKDQEIHGMPLAAFENGLQTLGLMLGEFTKTWETLPEIETPPQLMTSASDPITESYKELLDFDIFVLDRVANWLESSRMLYKSFEILSSHSIYLYFPGENVTIVEDNNLVIQFMAVERMKQYTWQRQLGGNQTVAIGLSKEGHEEISENSVILQMISFNSNPFWWYPDDQPLALNEFAINAFSTNSNKLKKSLAFDIPIDSLASAQDISVTIRNPYHMPIFIIQMPPNAAIFVTLTKADVSLFLEISMGKRPRSFQMKKSKRQNSTMSINHADQKRKAYIAVLAGEDLTDFPLHLNLNVNIIECLYWDWLAQDPQWSSKGCRPKALENSLSNLTCECMHLSTFAAKNYAALPYEDLRDSPLLRSLPINWNLVIFYAILLLIFIALIAYNTYRWKSMDDILLTSASNDDETLDMEVQIYTGSPSCSGTTANIHIRFVSEKGPYSVIIYQNPGRSQLIRNSLCKMRVSSQHIGTPFKLTLRHDGVGRYPLWFCHKINVINFNTIQSQLFLINNWISQKPLEFFASNKDPIFQEILIDHYINWYHLQAIFGPCSYTDLCCIQRCHIWVAQLMVSICIVACYYGPTTMATYEAERDEYNFSQETLKDVLLLSPACVLSSLIIKIMFPLICHD